MGPNIGICNPLPPPPLVIVKFGSELGNLYIFKNTYTKLSITLKQGKIFTQNEDI